MRYAVGIFLVAWLLPVAAHAAVLSSPDYTIGASWMTSGGSPTEYTSCSGVAASSVGKAVFIPLAGSSSHAYRIVPFVPAAGSIHTGDINGNGVVDMADALLALKKGFGLVQLTGAEIVRGDVGPMMNCVAVGDGRIDIEDAFLILRKAVGLGW